MIGLFQHTVPLLPAFGPPLFINTPIRVWTGRLVKLLRKNSNKFIWPSTNIQCDLKNFTMILKIFSKIIFCFITFLFLMHDA